MAGTSFLKVGALGNFGNRVKMTTEAWAENANPNTLRCDRCLFGLFFAQLIRATPLQTSRQAFRRLV